jgi:HEAT repeat protein
MSEQNQQLLSDDQVQRFIADGFVIIDSMLAPDFHQRVAKQIGYALEYELPHPGDNIVPRVPALNQLCESAAVQGALTSLLGEGFVFLPHRFPHNSDPLGFAAKTASQGKAGAIQPAPEADIETSSDRSDTSQMTAFATQPKMARGSISASAWHQDSHASCGRTRWHKPRAANVFYFPHATSMAMGPTRFLAGSHLYATLHDLRPEQAVMQEIPAGSVVIAHFDLVHAGSPNNSEQMRYMMKFVALRCENPTSPTWHSVEPQWRTPKNLQTHHELPDAWSSIWCWLRGEAPDPTLNNPLLDTHMAALVAGMKSADQQQRLSSLYGLVALGAVAVDTLLADLLSRADQGRHDKSAYKLPADTQEGHLGRFFLDGQFTPEDSAIALSAIGKPAVAALLGLLEHTDPWIRINAAYALGDAGPVVVGEHVSQMARLLDDPEPSVIRVTLDAFAALGAFDEHAIKSMRHFLSGAVPQWGANVETEPRLRMMGQMRYLSAIALLSWLSHSAAQLPHLVPQAEAALLESLQDENGYPALIACSALERSDSVHCLRAAVKYLRGRSWDSAQNSRQIGQWTIDHGRATLERIASLEHFKN